MFITRHLLDVYLILYYNLKSYYDLKSYLTKWQKEEEKKAHTKTAQVYAVKNFECRNHASIVGGGGGHYYI